MKTRTHIFFLSILACIVLALLPPIVLLLVDVNPSLVLLGIVGCFGWLVAASLLFYEGLVIDIVREALLSLGIKEQKGGITEIIDTFVDQAVRYHRAAYSMQGRSSQSQSKEKLVHNLKKIVSLTYEELQAQSVELSLFDDESGLSSQSMILGVPRSTEVQSMLLPEIERSGRFTKVDKDSEDGTVYSTPVTFAGNTFGMLRVEFPEKKQLSDSDIKVFQLLASQGAMLLVDAQFTEELLRMRKTSDESVRAKTGFLANLSHEIRGPLGVILNGVELAQEGLCGELSETMSETLKLIKGSADHLLDLVNDVLDYAKVESGKAQVTPIEIPLSGLLEDIVGVVRSQAIQKGLSLSLDPIDTDIAVICDKRHSRQMLINFLTNAIKYTPPEGSIKVWAEQLPGSRVKILIQDTGIGIAESEQHKVFGAFERVEDSYALSQCGTGLGMPLTASLAEANGGTVGFRSTQGEGSTFWLVLPSIQIDPVFFAEDTSDKATVEGKGETILLVDHDPQTRQMLTRYLDSLGFVTVSVDSGVSTLKALRNEDIQLALIENDIPDLPGEEMVAMIRSVPQGAAIPIVLMSAKAFVFDIEQFLKLGVDRCLPKPISLEELGFTIRILLDQSTRNDSSESVSDSEPTPLT